MFSEKEKRVIEQYFKGTQKEETSTVGILALEGIFYLNPIPNNPIPEFREGKIDLKILFPFGYPQYSSPKAFIKQKELWLFAHVRLDNGEICPLEPTKWFADTTLSNFFNYLNNFLIEAANNTLEGKDDYYELPHFPTEKETYLIHKLNKPTYWIAKSNIEMGILDYQFTEPLWIVIDINTGQLRLKGLKGIYIWFPGELVLKYKRPPLTFEEFDKVLLGFGSSLTAFLDAIYKLQPDNPSKILVILGFPIREKNIDSPSEVHWQGLVADLNNFQKFIKNERQKRYKPSNWYINALKIYANNLAKKEISYIESRDCSSKNLYSRIGGQVMINSALVFGCGAIGSNLAFEFVRAGCENLGLCDSQWLESGNICRHNLDFRSMKKNKAGALKDSLKYYNPWVNLKAYPFDVLGLQDQSKVLEEFCKYDYWIDAGLPAGVSACLSNFAHRYKKRMASVFITDKAKYLIIVISGKENILSIGKLEETLDRFLLERKLNECRELLVNPNSGIRTHIGCYFLTFEATGAEISMVASIAYSVLNDLAKEEYENGRIMVFKKEPTSFSFNLTLDEKVNA